MVPWVMAADVSADPFNVFAVGALSALAGFTAKLVLDQIADLRKRLDAANARTEAAVAAGHEVTTALAQLAAVVDSLVDTVQQHQPRPKEPGA